MKSNNSNEFKNYRKEMIKSLNSNNKGNKIIKSEKGNNKNNIKKNKVKNKNEEITSYYSVINDENEDDANKRIKEIEKEIQKNKEKEMKKAQLKRDEELKKVKFFENQRNKELLNLEIKVLKKLYGDLFIRIPNTFKQNHLSFENFIYEFGNDIHELFEFDKNNPSYDNLLREVNILIIRKYPISPDLTKFNRRELKKYFYDLGINDDWALIERYKSEMDKIEEKERLAKIAKSMKDYYKSLDDQIEQKKNIEKLEEEKKIEEKRKKMKDIEKIKLKNQKKIEQLQNNEKIIERLNKEKFEQINENEKLKQYFLKNLEEENKKMDENNINLIKFKLDNAMAIQTKQMDKYNQQFPYQTKLALNSGYNVPDEQISSIVDQIMLKKKEENKYKLLNFEDMINTDNNEKEELPDIKNIYGIDLEMEKKVNKILAEHKNK